MKYFLVKKSGEIFASDDTWDSSARLRELPASPVIKVKKLAKAFQDSAAADAKASELGLAAGTYKVLEVEG